MLRSLAEHGEAMSASEAAAVIHGVRMATLHTDYVSVAAKHCAPQASTPSLPARVAAWSINFVVLRPDLITSIQRASYYGRDVETAAENTGKGGGVLIVARTVTTLLVVTYGFPVVAAEAVPLAECFADKLIEHGL